MGFPECTGKSCKVIEYEVQHFVFQGAIQNVEDPQDEWFTTAADNLSEDAQNNWEKVIHQRISDEYSDLSRRQTVKCPGTECECVGSTVETPWFRSTHYEEVHDPAGKLAIIGIATYEVRRKTIAGACFAPETRTSALQLPEETVAALYSAKRPERKV